MGLVRLTTRGVSVRVIYGAILVVMPVFLILVMPAPAEALLRDKLSPIRDTVWQTVDGVDRTTERVTRPVLNTLRSVSPVQPSAPPAGSTSTPSPTPAPQYRSNSQSTSQPDSPATPAPAPEAAVDGPALRVEPPAPIDIMGVSTTGPSPSQQSRLETAAAIQPAPSLWVQATTGGWNLLGAAWYWWVLGVLTVVLTAKGARQLRSHRRLKIVNTA